MIIVQSRSVTPRNIFEKGFFNKIIMQEARVVTTTMLLIIIFLKINQVFITSTLLIIIQETKVMITCNDFVIDQYWL